MNIKSFFSILALVLSFSYLHAVPEIIEDSNNSSVDNLKKLTVAQKKVKSLIHGTTEFKINSRVTLLSVYSESAEDDYKYYVKIENPNSQEEESEGTPSRLFFLDRGVGPAKLLSAEIVDPLQLKLRIKVEAIRLVQREDSLDKVKKISTLDIGIGAEMTLSKTAILDSVSAN